MNCPLCKNLMVKMVSFLLPAIWKCKKCGYVEKA